ncbi:MAG: DUF3788 domain-containing protein [Chloroflexota bacterium]
MSVGCFVEKDHPPAEAELRAALGGQFALWEQLRQFILDTYQMPGEMSFGGKKYGWNLWYRKSGKSLVSLYPQQEHLVAQVVLGNAQVEQALQLELGENVGRLLRETPQLHDGRWLFIPVRTAQDAADVQQLLLVKKRPPRR